MYGLRRAVFQKKKKTASNSRRRVVTRIISYEVLESLVFVSILLPFFSFMGTVLPGTCYVRGRDATGPD